jgi:hypothetical protein
MVIFFYVKFVHTFNTGSEIVGKPQISIAAGLDGVGRLASCSDQLYTRRRRYFRN